jgi:hypothetical protein
MKNLALTNSQDLIEVRVTYLAKKMYVTNFIKVLLMILILGLLSLFSRVFAQTDVDRALSSASELRVAGFVNDLPQAEKLPGYINSSFKEVGPLVSPDGKTLFFSRQNHPDNTGGVLDHEDIWYSAYNEATGMWSAPEKMEAPVNNYGPNSINFMSVTGDTIVLANKYLKGGKMAAGMSMSVRENGHWSFPQALKIKDQINLSDQFNLSLSYNKQIVLTSQELDNTFGERDIYITFINPDGSQSTINAGSMINTAMEESSPFLAPDYKTLYFASKGHNGFGGYDIYVTHRLDETWQSWTEPENLGPGINSVNNEEFFNYTFDGQYAYFQSEINAENTDLYRVSLSGLYNAGEDIYDLNKKQSSIAGNSTVESMGLGDVRVKSSRMIEGLENNNGSRLAQIDE